jgi:hypothetical protein
LRIEILTRSDTSGKTGLQVTLLVLVFDTSTWQSGLSLLRETKLQKWFSGILRVK